MKNKIKSILLIIVLTIILFPVAASAESSEKFREKPNGRTPVYVEGTPVYVSASVLCNIEGDFAKNKINIPNVTGSFENGAFHIKLIRSSVNEVLKNNSCENVYTTLELYVDYINIDPAKKYYFFAERNSDGKYNLELAEKNYTFNNYNYIELISTSFPLAGIKMNEQLSYGGGMILFENDTYPSLPDYDEKSMYIDYTIDQIDINNPKPIINLKTTTIYAGIDEDVQIDLGNNNTIIDNYHSFDEQGNTVNNTVDMNNFYGEYLENQKIKYSWTMYDENGNPVKLDVNTKILIDDSSNEEKIIQSIDYNKEFSDLSDRITILSFEHEGELGGKAKIKVYVGDKFQPGSKITLYYYNPETSNLENLNNNIQYNDIVYDKFINENEKKYVNLFFFNNETCIFCEEEREWLNEIKTKYSKLRIFDYDIEKNKELFNNVNSLFNESGDGVPATIIGDHYYKGFSDSVKNEIENYIKEYSKTIEDKYVITVDEEGYVEIELTHCSEYVLADEEVSNVVEKNIEESYVEESNNEKETEKKANKENNESKGSNLNIVIGGSIFAIGLISFIITLIRFKKNKKS